MKVSLGLKTIAFLFLTVLLFDSCRKGENDPIFSLRTRQARLTGEWTLKTATWTVNDTTWNFSGSTLLKEFENSDEEPLNFKMTFGFEKDGTYFQQSQTDFPANYQNNGQPLFTETIRRDGVWNWAGGEDETPSKSKLLLLDSKITKSSSNNANIEVISVEGQNEGELFDIDKLLNKEMTFLYDKTTSTATVQTTETGSLELEKN